MFVFRKSKTLEQQKNQSTEKINGYVEEILYNFKTVTAFANYNYEQNKFNDELNTVSKHNKQFSNINAVSMGLIGAVIFLMFVFAFGFGGLFLYQTKRDNKQNEYNVGVLYSVLSLIIVAGKQVMEMFPNLRRLSECGVSMKMFFELKRYRECVEKSTNITETFLITPCNNTNNNVIPHTDNIKGKITFKNVTFMYPKGNENVLENFTCEFNAGTTTALIGESGCGKSTIVRLIERVYKPNSGSIVLDDVYDIQQMSLEGLRKEIGYVAQEPVLFNDSIRNNVLMGRSVDNADEKIWECLKKANVYEFVNSLPQRLDYVVGVKGSKVSGGQKQRIAIARALLDEPKIVVFDEATSALDNKSEKQIQEAMNALHGKVTVILIAHRLSPVKDADNIIVLGKKGSLVEMGNHNELMRKKGKYFAMITQENEFSGVNQCDDDNNNNKVYEEQGDCNSKGVLTVDSVNVNINDDGNVCNDTSNTTTSQSLKRFITTVKPFMLLFIVGLSLAFLSGVYNTVIGLFIGNVVSDLNSPIPNEVKVHARNYALYFILYTAISFLIEYFRFYSFDYLGECISVDFKRRIFSTFLSLHPGFYDIKSNSPGNLVSKMSMQTQAINGVVLTLFSMVLQGVGNLISGIIISAIYDWRLMLINIAFVPAIVVVNYLLVLYTADENKVKMNIHLTLLQ